MKNILKLLLLFVCSQAISQIEFEKGYFITSNGIKTDCYIRNTDWKSNPTQFEYQFTETGQKETGTLQAVKEFSITGICKYIRFSGGVDQTSVELNNFSAERNPKFEQKTLFLKVIKEADVSLYSYNDGILSLFFYKKGDNEIQQLIKKPYYVDNTDKVIFFQYYRQQLLGALDCKGMANYVDKVEYTKSGLTALFDQYYKCSGQEEKNVSFKEKQSNYSISIKPGVNFVSLEYDNKNNPQGNVDFGSKVAFRLGLELEYTLPFNNDEWSLFVEPTYQSYKSEKTMPAFGKVTVDSKSIILPLGLKYSYFLNKKSKLFADLNYNLVVSDKFDSEYQSSHTPIKVIKNNNFGAGIGYKFADTYSLEFRTVFGALGSTNFVDLDAKSNNFSLIFGYTLFNTKKK